MRINTLIRYIQVYLSLELILYLKGMNQFEMYSKYPEQIQKLQQIETDLTGGTTAVVALIINNRLYVANVGKII